MKSNYFKTFLIFFLLSTICLAGHTDTNKFKGRYTKEKKIKKEYTVHPDALLKIDNSYGNVDITSWDQDKVIIEVVVKTNGNDEEKVAEKLRDIDVDFNASASMVAAHTDIERSNRSWWRSLLSGDSNINMEINYTIKVPVTNNIDIDNDYGGIFLNRLQGNAKISCDYGNLDIGELLANDNYLNFDYTNNSTIGYMKSGRINADYSSFTLERAEQVELNADYSKSIVEAVKDFSFTCDYGSLTVNDAQRIKGRGDYLSIRLGKLRGEVNLTTDYGSIKIDELTPEAKNLKIQSDYTGVKIGYNRNLDFGFTIKLQYAGLGGEDNFEVIKRIVESSDKYYEGYYGSDNARCTVTINSEYGGVTFIEK